MAYFHLNDHEGAREQLSFVVEVDPENKAARWVLKAVQSTERKENSTHAANVVVVV